MNIKTISTIQSGAPLTGATKLLLSSTPCTIFDIEGEVNSTTGTSYYIQLLGTATPSSGVTIPLYSRLCVPPSASSGINGFSFVYRPDGIKTATMQNPVGAVATTGLNTLPVYIAISSTDALWTSVNATTNVTVDLEETYLEIPNQTIVGDTTTGVDSLAVWADATAAAAKRLIQIAVSNSVASTGTPLHLQLFGAVPSAGSIPIQEWTFTGTTLVTYRFGNGIEFQQTPQVLNSSGIYPGVNLPQSRGCYLYGSTTPMSTGFTATTGGNWTMQAFYSSIG